MTREELQREFDSVYPTELSTEDEALDFIESYKREICGKHFCVIDDEGLQALRDGKILVIWDGEYATLVKYQRSEE